MARKNRSASRSDAADGPDDTGTCRMCGASYSLDRVAGLYGRMAPGHEVSTDVAEFIDVDLCGFAMSAIVVGPDAPIRQAGFDVLFLVCSVDCIKVIRLAAGLDVLDRTGELPDPYAEGVEGLRRFNPDEGMSPERLERLARFEALLRDVAPAIARRLGCDQPPPRYGSDATPAERAAVESKFMNTCAWCMREMAEDGIVEAVTVRLNDPEPREDGINVIALSVGNRLVPAHLPEPRSEASMRGDAVIALCSKACVAELRAAIRADDGLSVVH